MVVLVGIFVVAALFVVARVGVIGPDDVALAETSRLWALPGSELVAVTVWAVLEC